MTSHIIAIDGPAGSGKSTVARAVAAQLGWSFLDTGAMYRAVTCEALFQGVDVHDERKMGSLAHESRIVLTPRVLVNDRDVQDLLRSEDVNIAVSVVAANPLVRSAMVERQRSLAKESAIGTVVEGRDIATVVFPDATLKVFLTATLEERAQRRGDEGVASVARRDEADSNRVTSPLRQDPDAVVLDTTGRDVEDVVEEIVQCLKNLTSS